MKRYHRHSRPRGMKGAEERLNFSPVEEGVESDRSEGEEGPHDLRDVPPSSSDHTPSVSDTWSDPSSNTEPSPTDVSHKRIGTLVTFFVVTSTLFFAIMVGIAAYIFLS